MKKARYGKVVIEPLNGGSGKITKHFNDVDDYINFRNAYCAFFPNETPGNMKHFAVGNGILNFQFDLNERV